MGSVVLYTSWIISYNIIKSIKLQLTTWASLPLRTYQRATPKAQSLIENLSSSFETFVNPNMAVELTIPDLRTSHQSHDPCHSVVLVTKNLIRRTLIPFDECFGDISWYPITHHNKKPSFVQVAWTDAVVNDIGSDGESTRYYFTWWLMIKWSMIWWVSVDKCRDFLVHTNSPWSPCVRFAVPEWSPRTWTVDPLIRLPL